MSLLTRLALACTALLPRAGNEPFAEWKPENGPRFSVLEVKDAPQQAFLAFLPCGLLADEPGEAQFAHLMEHMLIRSTDKSGLSDEGVAAPRHQREQLAFQAYRRASHTRGAHGDAGNRRQAGDLELINIGRVARRGGVHGQGQIFIDNIDHELAGVSDITQRILALVDAIDIADRNADCWRVRSNSVEEAERCQIARACQVNR
jgi:hypothetical protein